MMEPDATPPGFEAEQSIGSPVSSALSAAAPVTWLQIVGTVLGGLVTALGTWGAIILKRKRPKSGAEDAVYEVNRATIEDQRAQIDALKKENDTLRTTRNEFEAASVRAQANLEVAQAGAAAAVAAAKANLVELSSLRVKWEQAQRYIFMLRAELAKHNIPIPPEPTALG